MLQCIDSDVASTSYYAFFIQMKQLLSCLEMSTITILSMGIGKFASYWWNDPGQSKIKVSCGLISNLVIDPFFFCWAHCHHMLDMMQISAVIQVCYLHQNIFWQQDGAPPHWGKIVRDYWNEEFAGRWFGRNCPLLWPVLNSTRFFLVVLCERRSVCICWGWRWSTHDENHACYPVSSATNASEHVDWIAVWMWLDLLRVHT